MSHFIKITSIIIIGFSLFSCAAHKNLEHSESSSLNSNYAEDTMTRTGLINPQELVSRYSAFKSQYESYQPEEKDVKNLTLLKGMDVVVFFGLWCHDSQREVPRLIKLIEQSGSPFKSVKLVAINTKKELMQDYAGQFEVKYTPTIFVLKNGQTLAKIIEKPNGTIAQDLLGQILH